MPCECLIVANPKTAAGWRKCEVCVVKDAPCDWGYSEGPPNWVILKISDATKSQVESFLGEWLTGIFIFSIVAQNEQGYRVRVEVDPEIISASGLNKSVRKGVRDYLVGTYQASIHEYGDDYAIVDIPKPADLLEIRDGLLDLFQERYAMRRYYFGSADVDLALSQGGIIELTRTQALNKINDRLAE